MAEQPAEQPANADEDSLAPRRSQASAGPSFRPSSIILVDHTKPADADAPLSPTLTEDPGEASSTRVRSGLASSLRDQRQRWKYARYSEDRANRPGSPQSDGVASDGERDGGSTWGRSTFEQQRHNVRALFRARRQHQQHQQQHGGSRGEDAEYDVLYENQRGAFLFGAPFFSARALLSQLEPSAWVDASLRKSRVSVANAQLPDPSWEWAWRTWYVDMGRDVDEEGWEYSLAFRGCAWHGTHPWFSSFVRRRRWLRKRVRRRARAAGEDGGGGGAHGMSPEYFTIHSERLRTVASSPVGGRSPSVLQKEWGPDENAAWEEADISDIATLLRALKEAPVDSERISLIRKFLEQGGDDLNYLADEIPTIVTYFFYENSVQRLLDAINSRLAELTRQGRDEPESAGRSTPDGPKGLAVSSPSVATLRKAADAVAQECEKLEFWSDARQATEKVHEAHRTVHFAAPSYDNEDVTDESAASTHDSSSDSRDTSENRPGSADGGVEQSLADGQHDVGSADAVAIASAPQVESNNKPSERDDFEDAREDSTAPVEGSQGSHAVAVARESPAPRDDEPSAEELRNDNQRGAGSTAAAAVSREPPAAEATQKPPDERNGETEGENPEDEPAVAV